MPDRPPDSRTLNFAGDVDEQGRPLPMTVEVLQARTEKWPLSPQTPDGVAALLAHSRQLFVDGYCTYENFFDAATRSLQAVEAALRVRFDAGEKIPFAKLIDRARSGKPCRRADPGPPPHWPQVEKRSGPCNGDVVLQPRHRCHGYRDIAQAGGGAV